MNNISNTDWLNRMQKIGSVGNWELDFSTGKAIWSDEACRIYGLPPEDNVHCYKDWEAFIHPEDVDMVHKAYQDSQDGYKSYEVQHRIVRRDGTIAHIYTHLDYIINDEGHPTGLYGITNDLTDIINLKNELVKSESNIRLMMNLIPISVYARDADGYYIFANHVFLNHYGITYEELKGKHLRDFVRNEREYQLLREQEKEVLRTEDKLVVSEFRQTNHEGTEKVWKIVKVPFTPEGQSKMAVLGIAEDITEQSQYADNLRRIAHSLEERNKALEEYSFMVSHELRGPLTTIMGISDLVKNFKMSQEELEYFFSGLETSLNKLDGVIRKMNLLLADKQ